MLRKMILIVVILLPQASQANRQVTLVVDDAPVTQILQAMAELEQKNLVIAPGVTGKLSLRLVGVPWEQAFAQVIKAADLLSVRTGNILQVQSREDMTRQQRQRETQRQQQQTMPVVHKVYTPRYADVKELAAALKLNGEKLLGPNGHVTVDTRAGRLIVRDHPQAQKQIARWVADMDIPLGQVELTAHIVTMSQETLRELGIKWSTKIANGSDLYRVSAATSHPAAGLVSAGLHIGRIGGRMLELELSALEQQKRLQIIASPRLLVAHQQQASIKQGTEIPYQVSGGATAASSVAFKEAVLGMDVTPTINAHGHIRLKLRITQNMPGRSLQHAEGEALAIDKQEIETQVDVLDGETLALGGIFQQHQRVGAHRVPWLSDLPVIGQLFHDDSKTTQRQELVVLITSKLLPDR